MRGIAIDFMLPMPNHGMVITRSWLRMVTPRVLMHGDSMVIIHSIVPYHKRAREDA